MNKTKRKGLRNHVHYFKGAAFGTLGFCTSWAVDSHGHGAEWIEVIQVDLQLRNLPEQFHGKRIVHVSDLHCSRTVSGKYLRRCVERINQLDADIVVLTGDYITYDKNGRFREKVAELVGSIQSRHGVYACLGNHDYGIGSMLGGGHNSMVWEMVENMAAGGVNVLRNESSVLEIDGKQLWFVGLGDLWVDDLGLEQAFDGVPENEVVIVLAHNPETIEYLQPFGADAVMSGHTHGLGVHFDKRGRWGIKSRRFHAGMYEIGGKKLYVNRGLGRLGRALFNPRPEITEFVLCEKVG